MTIAVDWDVKHQFKQTTKDIMFLVFVKLKAALPYMCDRIKYYRIYIKSLLLELTRWDIGKHNSLRCDAAERGVPSGAILEFSSKN